MNLNSDKTAVVISGQMGAKLATVVLHIPPSLPPPPGPPITIIQFTPHLLPIPLLARHCSQKGETPPTHAADVDKIFPSQVSPSPCFFIKAFFIYLQSTYPSDDNTKLANTQRIYKMETSFEVLPIEVDSLVVGCLVVGDPSVARNKELLWQGGEGWALMNKAIRRWGRSSRPKQIPTTRDRLI